MVKSIIICADDYAQNEPISEGILQLLNRGRINATSCLVNSRLWPEMAQNLNAQIRVGLHGNLTHGDALSRAWREQYGIRFPKLSQLMIWAYSGRLQHEVIFAELMAQCDAFTQGMNRLPDFLDGHQHVHQLPGIRNALLQVYDRYQLTGFIRSTSNGYKDIFIPSGFPKRQLINVLGGVQFKRLLCHKDIATNTSFSGIYNFAKAQQYTQYFKQFLAESVSNGLIMCHPGMVSNDQQDPLRAFRHYEFNYFMSNDFLQDLDDNAVQLNYV